MHFDFSKEVILGIRTIRKDKNISFNESIQFSAINNENTSTQFDEVIKKNRKPRNF